MNSQEFDRMIAKSQKKREAKYQPFWSQIEQIVQPHSSLRTYWRSADRHEKATVTASLLFENSGEGVLPSAESCLRFITRRIELLTLRPEVINEHS